VRLRVSIYNEPAGHGIGGSEFVAACLAETLAKDHDVDLFHRIPTLSAETLGDNSGTDLRSVRLHYASIGDSSPFQFSRQNPISHYKNCRDLHSQLSQGYDLFIPIVHDIPPFCHARRGALIVLFPTPTAPYIKPEGGLELKLAVKHPGGYLYHNWAWRQRMKSYQVKTAISGFSREWAEKRWRIDCQVVYPPVDTRFRITPKENLILSVGRFAIEGEGHRKNQEEMLRTFGQMKGVRTVGWQYWSVGGLGTKPEHKQFFQTLSTLADSSGARVIANIEREELRRMYERASIFWHASGYGEDQNIRPIYVEHFGIATVEAMAAGCVPVVINKGGQSEIVEHGVSGFLWQTLDELRDYTSRLVDDAPLRAKMSDAARKRAELFSKESFLTNFVGRVIP